MISDSSFFYDGVTLAVNDTIIFKYDNDTEYICFVKELDSFYEENNATITPLWGRLINCKFNESPLYWNDSQAYNGEYLWYFTNFEPDVVKSTLYPATVNNKDVCIITGSNTKTSLAFPFIIKQAFYLLFLDAYFDFPDTAFDTFRTDTDFDSKKNILLVDTYINIQYWGMSIFDKCNDIFQMFQKSFVHTGDTYYFKEIDNVILSLYPDGFREPSKEEKTYENIRVTSDTYESETNRSWLKTIDIPEIYTYTGATSSVTQIDITDDVADLFNANIGVAKKYLVYSDDFSTFTTSTKSKTDYFNNSSGSFKSKLKVRVE